MNQRMVALLTALIVLVCGNGSVCAQYDTAIKIMPEPAAVVREAGNYVLSNAIKVYYSDLSGDMQFIKNEFSSRINKLSSAFVLSESGSGDANVRFVINKKSDTALKDEGYRLIVGTKGVTVYANKAAGLYYGIQTFMQLLPALLPSESNAAASLSVPYVSVTDYPRYGWRGLMLDVSRHFFTKAEVIHYIEEMSRYKFNVFHWHLTDDEGWRIEIKSFPRLTSVGAWNVKKIGYFGSFSPVSDTDKYDYGGFYTQDDIREVVEYAREHFVNILPEVDMPGHSMAAVVSYPELSCTPGADKYHLQSGARGFMDWTDSGIVAHYDNTLCPANPKVYSFIDKVVTEMASLFPFPYLHIGGDECAKTFWKTNPAILALMKQEKLKTMEEVQSYFEKRVEKIVESKGKKVIGWDEILEGGLASNAAVMSWRGEKGGIEASQMKHDVIMSPTTYAYLDYMQGDAALEPQVYAVLRLKKAYQFEPVPPGADASYIKGGQANLWSEQLYNIRHAEYMTWPRAFAISESLWTPKEKKDWNSFIERTEAQFPRLDADSVNYAPSMYDPDISVSFNADSTLRITLSKELDNTDLYYSVDNSFPDKFYPKYTAAFSMPKDAAMLRVISYRDGKPIGRLMTVSKSALEKRAQKKERQE